MIFYTKILFLEKNIFNLWNLYSIILMVDLRFMQVNTVIRGDWNYEQNRACSKG